MKICLFVLCPEIDERSHVTAGLFCAASQLRWSESLPDYEFDALTELKDWFNVHMDSPFDHLPRDRQYERAICWFKPTAREHLERAWELVAILERNDVLIWTVKSPRTEGVRVSIPRPIRSFHKPLVRLERDPDSNLRP